MDNSQIENTIEHPQKTGGIEVIHILTNLPDNVMNQKSTNNCNNITNHGKKQLSASSGYYKQRKHLLTPLYIHNYEKNNEPSIYEGEFFK